MKRIAAVLFLALLPAVAYATVTNTTLSVSYTCTNTTGPFFFTFPISDPTALTVTQNQVVLASSAWTSLPVNNNYENGGNVTLVSACPTNQVLVIQRITPVLQQTIFTDNMPQPMSAFMYGLDKLTEIAQEQQSTLDNALCQPGQVMQSIVPLVCVAINGGSGPGTNYVSTVTATQQNMTGPLGSPYLQASAPVPFSVFSGSSLGWGFTNQEADVYTGTNTGATTPAFQVWHPNGGNSAWESLLELFHNGNLSVLGNFATSVTGSCYNLPALAQGICDDGSTHGITYEAATGATYGHRFYMGATLVGQINANGWVGTAALTGTPTAPTHGSCASDTQIATGAYVANCASGSGVTSLSLTTTGTSGASTGNISGGTLTLNIPQYTSTTIAPVTLAIPGGLAASGNTCYRWQSGTTWSAAPATAPTITMTGVVTAGVPSWVGSGLQGSTYLTTGWGATGGLILNVWPSAANTVSWEVCNQTAGLINSGTPSFTIKASN